MNTPKARASDRHRVSRVLSFGIYSTRPEYPRHTNLLGGLRAQGVEVVECRDRVAETLGDRLSSVTSITGTLRFAAALIRSYPRLASRFPRRIPVDAIIVGYPGIFHVHIARWLRDRFQPTAAVLLDVFFPLHEALVGDRRIFGGRRFLARVLERWESRSYEIPEGLMIDTGSHADSLARHYAASRERVSPVWVGPTFAPAPEPLAPRRADQGFRVVFVGTYIPLHGIEVILEGARRLGPESGVSFDIVGSGQLREQVQARYRGADLGHVAFRDWVPARELRDLYRSYDLGLGIFGATEKATKVIPIKAFDMCAAGIPFVTADTRAIREGFRHGENAWLVPAGSPEALAEAIQHLRAHPEIRRSLAIAGLRVAREAFSPTNIGGQVLNAIQEARARRAGA